jgi:hypothetical protein
MVCWLWTISVEQNSARPLLKNLSPAPSISAVGVRSTPPPTRRGATICQGRLCRLFSRWLRRDGYSRGMGKCCASLPRSTPPLPCATARLDVRTRTPRTVDRTVIGSEPTASGMAHVLRAQEAGGHSWTPHRPALSPTAAFRRRKLSLPWPRRTWPRSAAAFPMRCCLIARRQQAGGIQTLL